MRHLRLFENFEAPLQKIEDWAKSKGVKYTFRPTSIVLQNVYSQWKYYFVNGEWQMNWGNDYSHMEGVKRAMWIEKPSSPEDFISTFVKINNAEKVFRVVLFLLKNFEADLSKQGKRLEWRIDEKKGFTTMIAWSYPEDDHHGNFLFTIEYSYGKFLMNDYSVGKMRDTPVDEKTGELIEKILACTIFYDKTVIDVVHAMRKMKLKRCLEIIGNPPDWKRASVQLRGSIASNRFNF